MTPLFAQLFSQFFRMRLPRSRNSQTRAIISNIIKGLAAAGIAMMLFSRIEVLMTRRAEQTREKLGLARVLGEQYGIVQRLGSDYKRLNPVFPAISQAIPFAYDIVVFENLMERLAKDTGNKITFQFSSQEPSQDSQIPTIFHANFNATLEGTKETFVRFLREFNHLRMMSAIDNISLTSTEGINGPGSMTVNGHLFIKKNAL